VGQLVARRSACDRLARLRQTGQTGRQFLMSGRAGDRLARAGQCRQPSRQVYACPVEVAPVAPGCRRVDAGAKVEMLTFRDADVQRGNSRCISPAALTASGTVSKRAMRPSPRPFTIMPSQRGRITPVTLRMKSAHRRTVNASSSRISRTDSTRSTNNTTVSCRTSPTPSSRSSECSVRAACFSSPTQSPLMLIGLALRKLVSQFV
jgi:hypothetical protein